MQPRINFFKVAPNVIPALRGISEYDSSVSLEESLVDLVLIRASQINRCAQCLDMHIKDARASGETEQRIYSLSAWRETPFYSDRERAALSWTEVVTLLSETGVPDDVYEEVRGQFSEAEIVKLTMLVIAINCWNRLNVSLRAVPGHYKSQRKPAAVTA